MQFHWCNARKLYFWTKINPFTSTFSFHFDCDIISLCIWRIAYYVSTEQLTWIHITFQNICTTPYFLFHCKLRLISPEYHIYHVSVIILNIVPTCFDQKQKKWCRIWLNVSRDKYKANAEVGGDFQLVTKSNLNVWQKHVENKITYKK